MNTQVYGYNNVTYGVEGHRGVTLQVHYTFSYGKKVEKGDELGEERPGKSSILR